MSDVFDEDLIKELGLDPEDVMGPKENQPGKPVPHVSAGPSPQARATMGQPQKAGVKPAGTVKPPVTPDQKTTLTAAQPPIKATPATFEVEATSVAEDLPIQVAAVLAKRSFALKEILSLKAGEIIEFKKAPQEPVDLVANGRLIGRCELVLVDGKLGARILKLVQ